MYELKQRKNNVTFSPFSWRKTPVNLSNPCSVSMNFKITDLTGVQDNIRRLTSNWY